MAETPKSIKLQFLVEVEVPITLYVEGTSPEEAAEIEQHNIEVGLETVGEVISVAANLDWPMKVRVTPVD